MFIGFRQLTLSLCLIGLSASAWSQAVLIKNLKDIEEYQLENGFKVVLAPNPKENKVFVNTIYFTGSLNDPKGKGGLAHLLEHLAFKGTQDVKGKEFQRRLDQYTLQSNASTEYHSTRYTNIVRPEEKALDEILYLESQRMDKLVLQPQFVPSEIEIVKREREIRMDQPFAVLMDKIFKAAYGNQYLGRLPIGDLPELKSIQLAELQNFYKTWYAPNNAVMVVAGKFDKAQVLKTVEQNFGPIPARTIPAQVSVPALDSSRIQPREFLVQKGSDLAKFNIYLDQSNPKTQATLALSPYLYTMQPSGHLYQGLVETGTATAVQAATWLDQNINLVFLGAIYAPSNNPNQVEAGLVKQVEQGKAFDQTELDRVKTLFQTQADLIMSSSVALGSRLSDYVVNSHGNWQQFFIDLDAIKQLKVQDVNQVYKQFLTVPHRIIGDIQPTPDSKKQALKQKEQAKLIPLSQQENKEEALKDAAVYKQEVNQYLKTSDQYLQATEKKIQRGQLSNGMQYALFPVSTRDDQTYATLTLNFGTAQTLFNKGTIIDLTSYLLLRGTDQYTLQNIADKSIAAGGGASVSAVDNGMVINIQARKDKFADYFKFIVDVMKHPTFEQSQFDLIKSQSLASLDRPYTEPETVAALTIARLIETYQPGDLRYHFEPTLAKQQLDQATQAQVAQLYRQYFAMDHAQIAITGDFNAQQMQQFLKEAFAHWSNQSEPYQKIIAPYQAYSARTVHALSEQREFGNYQSILTIPVGNDHPDAAALIVLNQILGKSQLSSRLAKELREKNALVYGFSTNLQLDDDTNSGAFTIGANYAAGRGTQVSASVHHVLQNLIQGGVTEQELEAAKAEILKQRVTALEDERNIHRMLNSQLEHKKNMENRAQRDRAIATLTRQDIDQVIKKYIKLDQLVEVTADQYGQAQKNK